jgi:hypothetical protein
LLEFGVTFLAILAAAALLGHVLVSCLLRRICIKAGAPPDLLIWVPLLQLVPLARAARMSPGSVLLVGAAAVAGPVLQGVSSPYASLANAAGLVVILLFWLTWCVKICQARKKSPLLAVPLALPGLNLLALLYLAGSE